MYASKLVVDFVSSCAIVVGVCGLFASGSDAGDETDSSAPAAMMLINPDGTNLRRLMSFDHAGGSPQWSPDGRQIAYDTWRANETYADSVIEIVDTKSHERRRLGKGAMPSWSPDGTQIVCHTYDTPRAIVVMNVDGTGREPIMDHWGSPRWSPLGHQIVSAVGKGGFSVFDIASGEERIILSRTPVFQGLSVSPNGRQVCFGRRRGGIVVATLNSAANDASTKVIAQFGECYHSSWSPDGTQIVMNWLPTNAKVAQLYLYNVDHDAPPRVFPGQDALRDNRDPSWSPDGETIVFVSMPAER